tara:strand:- start:47 stop:322 length:276 start_codon:yes stop_codon:yes gene_type:complete
MCQKIINVLAVASFAVSSSIAAGGVYVYVNRDSIIDGIKSQVMGGLGGAALGGGALTGDVGLPIDTQPQASAPSPAMSGDSMGLPVPGSAF